MEKHFNYLTETEIKSFLQKNSNEKIFSLLENQQQQLRDIMDSKENLINIDLTQGTIDQISKSISCKREVDYFILLFVLNNIFYKEEISTCAEVYKHDFYAETILPYVNDKYCDLKTAIIIDALILYYYRNCIRGIVIDGMLKSDDRKEVDEEIEIIKRSKLFLNNSSETKDILESLSNCIGKDLMLLLPSIRFIVNGSINFYSEIDKHNICKYLPYIGLLYPEVFSDAEEFNKLVYKTHSNRYNNNKKNHKEPWRSGDNYKKYCKKKTLAQELSYIETIYKSAAKKGKKFEIIELTQFCKILNMTSNHKSLSILHFNYLTRLIDLACIGKKLSVEAARISGLALKHVLSVGYAQEDDFCIDPECIVHYPSQREKVKQIVELKSIIEEIINKQAFTDSTEDQLRELEVCWKKMPDEILGSADFIAGLKDDDFINTPTDLHGYSVIKKPLNIDDEQIELFNLMIEGIFDNFDIINRNHQRERFGNIDLVGEFCDLFIKMNDPYFVILNDLKKVKIEKDDILLFHKALKRQLSLTPTARQR